MAWTTPRDFVTAELITSTILNVHLRDNLKGVLPIGTYILRVAQYGAGESAVEGRWLQCNGVNVSRTTFAELFAYFNGLIPAMPFGVGDGSTTFGIPDLRGRTAYAQGEHADVDGIGDSDGATIANRRPKHFHYVHLNLLGNQGGGGAGAGSADADTVVTKEGATNNIEGQPAFQVAGSYFIKYTN